MFAATLHVQKLARRQLANQIANAKFDLAFQALYGDVAWHFMWRKLIAGKQYDSNDFEIIGFDNRMRNCRYN
jgi:hypothetical protein